MTVDITSMTLLHDDQTVIDLSSDRLSLILRNVSYKSSGIYTVMATNEAGTGRTSFNVEVQSKLMN